MPLMTPRLPAIALTLVGILAGIGTAKANADAVLVARLSRDGTPTRPLVLPGAVWRSFIAESRQRRDAVASSATAAADTRNRAAVAAAAAAMRERVPEFIDWRFSYFTSYRLLFAGVISGIGGGDGEAAARSAVADRFRDTVLKPEATRHTLVTALEATATDVTTRRDALIEERVRALNDLAHAHTLAGPAPADALLVTEIDALGLPPPALAPAAVGIPDLSNQASDIANNEVLAIVGRQAARRGAGYLAEPPLATLAPPLTLEAAPWLAGPVVGGLALGVSLTVEYGMLRAWETTARPDFTTLTAHAVDAHEAAFLEAVRPLTNRIIDNTLGRAPCPAPDPSIVAYSCDAQAGQTP